MEHHSIPSFGGPRQGRVWAIGAALVSLALFISTLQPDINGGLSPYSTDVGEIQNALPRWGTIHYTGYPQFSFLGSLFVTGLRWMGIAPAAGAALFSALWGALTVYLLALLALELGAPPLAATLAGLLAAVSTSLWIDSSLAEVHSMTMALLVGSLLFGVRFGRRGERRDFFWLALFFTQGVVHNRAVAGVLPAMLLLAWPHRREALKAWRPALGLALLAPLSYIYLPIRDWMGASWTFGDPGSWRGLWTIASDLKAARSLNLAQLGSSPVSSGSAGERLAQVAGAIGADLPLVLVALGLAGLLLQWRAGRPREALALTAAWAVFFAACLIVWRGFIGDAILALKLPVVLLAAVGLASPSHQSSDFSRQSAVSRLPSAVCRLRAAGPLVLGIIVVWLGISHRPEVLAVTRDSGAEERIRIAAQVAPPPPNIPVMFVALWGRDYWSLAYAQEYRGELPGLRLVDHNAGFEELVRLGNQLWTFTETFIPFPLTWWEGRLGELHLSTVAPGVVQMAIRPSSGAAIAALFEFDLGNGILARSAQITWPDPETLLVTVEWQAEQVPPQDYSVAVHLVSADPPRGPDDILAQADKLHPVEGLYPTSQWSPGEVVRDIYRLPVPPGASPQAVRLTMYRTEPSGEFVNMDWLSIPLH